MTRRAPISFTVVTLTLLILYDADSKRARISEVKEIE